MIVPESRLTEALTMLAESDEKAARAKALMVGLDKQEKTVLSAEFLTYEGTIPEREARARISPSYKDWRNDYQDAVLDYELLKTKRGHEELIVEVWRTDSANKRKGTL